MRGRLLLVLLAAGCASTGAPDVPVYDGKPLSHWVRELHDLNPTRSEEAGKAIWWFGPAAVPHLRRALDSDQVATRRNAATALRNVAVRHPDAAGVVPAVLHAIESRDEALRANAVHSFAAMDPSPPEAVDALRRMDKDPVEGLRRLAAQSLETLLAKIGKPK
jgi:HEAT repeat protein